MSDKFFVQLTLSSGFCYVLSEEFYQILAAVLFLFFFCCCFFFFFFYLLLKLSWKFVVTFLR